MARTGICHKRLCCKHNVAWHIQCRVNIKRNWGKVLSAIHQHRRHRQWRRLMQEHTQNQTILNVNLISQKIHISAITWPCSIYWYPNKSSFRTRMYMKVWYVQSVQNDWVTRTHATIVYVAISWRIKQTFQRIRLPASDNPLSDCLFTSKTVLTAAPPFFCAPKFKIRIKFVKLSKKISKF